MSALLALGISLGLNYSSITGSFDGPDLLTLLRKSDRNEIPEDIREECFDGIDDTEPPQKGYWLTIWEAPN